MLNPLVRRWFDELAQLTAEEQARAFAEGRVPAEIRDEVASLLSFDSTNGHSLTRCVGEAAEDLLRAAAGGGLGSCGPYRLLRLLGSGGMGAVYLAERSDGEIQQKVAIKLLRADSHRPAWRDRFLRERQLLASMNHASIVHVLDAGHTGQGQPYLVMEYVEGVPIDVYAAQIPVRERLKLFIQVCEGVSHAHRHLIIHRDLKPSNILVDGAGQPKLLDFGIAKLLDETGDSTETVERLLTPNYASPEQVRGAAQTTATDVYSLGAVLYRLMTNRSPQEGEERARGREGRRQIRPATQWNETLPGDVDYILRKALREEPEERYATVDAFANDIRALLENRPVEARAGDAWYWTRRYARRYWVPLTAGAVLLVGLAAGLQVVNRERRIAQRRFLEVRQLANKLFDIDALVRQAPGTTKARQMIVDTSLAYLRRLATEAHGDPELALELGNAYMRVARVQGVPFPGNLGQMEQAEGSLAQAERLMQSVLAAEPGNRTAMLRSAQIACDRMMVAWWLRRPKGQPLEFAKESWEWLDRYLRSGAVDAAETDTVLLTAINVAVQNLREDHPDEALRICRRTLELARSLDRPRRAGAALEIMAGIYSERGELEEALQSIEESVKLLEPPRGSADIGKTMNLTMALMREGQILDDDKAVSLGRAREADQTLERAFQLAGNLASKDSLDFASGERFAETGILLAGVVRHTNPRRSVEIYDRALARMAGISSNNAQARRLEVQALAGSVYPLLRLGRYGEARQRLDGAFSRLSQLKLFPAGQIQLGSEPDDALRALAEYHAATGSIARGVEAYQRLIDGAMASKPNAESHLREAYHLANIYRRAAVLNRLAGHDGAAAQLEARHRQLVQMWDARLPHNAVVHGQLAAANFP